MVKHILCFAVAVLLSLLVQSPATAQDRTSPRRVGWISIESEEVARRATASRGGSVVNAAFADLGYRLGEDLIIDVRHSAGRFEQGPQLANELLQAGAEVLVTGGYELSEAALRVTRTVPVVGVGCGVEQLVESLARPGGNFTGVSCQALDLPAKHLQLMSEIVTGERQIVALVNPNSHNTPIVTEQLKHAATELILTVPLMSVGTADMIDKTFAEIARLGFRGAVVAPDSLFWAERERFAAAAKTHRIGVITSYREVPDLGGLISYGTSIRDLVRRAVGVVDKILKGVRPTDFPMQQPTKFELVVNLRTARELQLAIPQSILLRADEVIE
jgi:putative tryptophan/tyrosine transport system substrate-binding protein